MAIVVASLFLLLCAAFLTLALGICRLSGEAEQTYYDVLSNREGRGTPAS
ncbi:MAG: hypothetical protein M5R41_00740 [Bacteroidia bacterium]|nr:hypothetical protein [Bacteroidia bacterium]